MIVVIIHKEIKSRETTHFWDSGQSKTNSCHCNKTANFNIINYLVNERLSQLNNITRIIEV